MKRAPNQPEDAPASLYGGVFVKAWRMPDAGMLVPQHAHTYPHISFLARGSVAVSRDDPETGARTTETHHAPAAIRIRERTKHSFLTLSDDVLVLCIHSAERGEAADIQEEHELALEG